ncbi:hypothetical protein [Actinokineospora sp. UTMC 2448]|uniref:hypothetical protein n=1 Tax=Actinokineospora sp. UTMC 2448 TaxID=2268449 RepID=UPI0021647E3A|nr:hypothetical protein [Actinokineospora sp. UTMC 2448]UVS81848.1 hypothetical protein Actkin_05612 [Actinokineospora sp. UTMC 2448]
MAKENGLGLVVIVDDAAGTPRTISNDITNCSWATPRGVQDVTGVDKSAMERLLLHADLTVDYAGVINDASNQSHDVFKTVPSTSVARTNTLQISGQELEAELLFTDYAFTRATSGELTFSAPGVLADGTVPTWGLAA